jgi:hypothetical protein
MIVDTVDRQTIRAAVELGSHAPSVHNSQPWRWRLDGRSLLLQADLRRWLPATDADGRDRVVSCGAVLHHTRIATTRPSTCCVTLDAASRTCRRCCWSPTATTRSAPGTRCTASSG